MSPVILSEAPFIVVIYLFIFLVVVHDMFNLLELLGKISAILDYSNSMLLHVNADGAIGYPIGFLRQYNVYASLKTEFSKNK